MIKLVWVFYYFLLILQAIFVLSRCVHSCCFQFTRPRKPQWTGPDRHTWAKVEKRSNEYYPLHPLSDPPEQKPRPFASPLLQDKKENVLKDSLSFQKKGRKKKLLLACGKKELKCGSCQDFFLHKWLFTHARDFQSWHCGLSETFSASGQASRLTVFVCKKGRVKRETSIKVKTNSALNRPIQRSQWGQFVPKT